MEKAQKPMEGEEKNRGASAPPEPSQYQFPYQYQYQYPVQQQQQQYGTFQPTGPVPVGYPQPSAPPGSAVPGYYPPAAGPGYYQHGFQPVSGYAVVAEGRPMRIHRDRLPCCGFGVGWLLFVAGFFFAAVPWYVGAFILLCVGVDYREKPGLIACTIAALLAAIAVLLGFTKSTAIW
ncbi:hypothetical protein LUZ60_008191 [Juncus effusus]|nr:hypothetical protein LUZ60_008191 [Juncus effusus]